MRLAGLRKIFRDLWGWLRGYRRLHRTYVVPTAIDARVLDAIRAQGYDPLKQDRLLDACYYPSLTKTAIQKRQARHVRNLLNAGRGAYHNFTINEVRFENKQRVQ